MMNKVAIAIVGLLLFQAHAIARERGGATPQEVAARYARAISANDIEEVSACISNSERSPMLIFNLVSAAEASTVLTGISQKALNSPQFTADQLPQKTVKQREFVELIKRNGIKLGGPPTPAVGLDPYAHFSSIAGPNPDKSLAELDAYNRHYLRDANPTDLLLRMFPEPIFSKFEINAGRAKARMGHTTVTFVQQSGRWLMSDFVSFEIEAEAE